MARDNRRKQVECLCGCGRVWMSTESRLSQKYHSKECVSAARRLPEVKVRSMAEKGYSRRRVSELLEIPYPTLIRKLVAAGMNGIFLGRGKYHSTESFIVNRAEEFMLQHSL